MDPRIPNEDERRKLKKMARSFKINIINVIILSGSYWIVRYLFEPFPLMQIAIYITILIVTFYLLLKIVLLNKCPRCAAWGTPVTGGHCARCGLHLDPSSKEVDSHDFADLLKDKTEVNLYIGGAYGFESSFLSKCNKAISFGKITLSHKLVKVVLLEQIFRGLSINNNHPYHK